MGIKTIVKKDYDSFYEQPTPLKSLRSRYDYIFKTMVETGLAFSAFEKGELILDAGCGTGRLSMLCAEKGARVLGVDISIYGINFAHWNKDGYNCDFLVADVEHLPFRKEIFGAIFFFGTFEYIDEMMVRRILKESYRVSRFEGRLLFNVWNKHGLRFRTLITLPLRLGRSPHSRWKFRRYEYSLKELIEKTTGCGYKIEHYSGHFFIDPGDMLSLRKVLRGRTPRLFHFLCDLNAKITNSVIGPYVSINLMIKMKKARK